MISVVELYKKDGLYDIENGGKEGGYKCINLLTFWDIIHNMNTY